MWLDSKQYKDYQNFQTNHCMDCSTTVMQVEKSFLGQRTGQVGDQFRKKNKSEMH